ncbi:hypothetical protein [Bradyrhizobium sp. SBR1B]|uniref:hypothetical protein n=1 Tax=Bradyrhizobium sp. SBR1B TaxID=2663836 RepID=UPI0018119455|nr:hypothetical protein [Bradyrhizobium sp. SBR1B]MBB4383145.1 hypothetical protein [Bradyrhizobium sp. SBR1B]
MELPQTRMTRTFWLIQRRWPRTVTRTRRPQPQARLAQIFLQLNISPHLLEVMSEEILAASEEEVLQTSALQGWIIASIAHEVGQVIPLLAPVWLIAQQGAPHARLPTTDFRLACRSGSSRILV